MNTVKTIWLVCVILILVAWGQTVYRILHNPYAQRASHLENRINESPTMESLPDNLQASYEDAYKKITSRPELWQALVKPPKAPSQEPNWKIILGDLKVVQVVANEKEARVKIRMGQADNRGQWISKGSVVNGATVKEITPSAIVFVITQGDREYVHTFPIK